VRLDQSFAICLGTVGAVSRSQKRNHFKGFLHLNILINSESGMVEVGYESTGYIPMSRN